MEFLELLIRILGLVAVIIVIAKWLRYFVTIYLPGEDPVSISTTISPVDYFTSFKFWWPEKQEHPVEYASIGILGGYFMFAPFLISLSFVLGCAIFLVIIRIRERNIRIKEAASILSGERDEQ